MSNECQNCISTLPILSKGKCIDCGRDFLPTQQDSKTQDKLHGKSDTSVVSTGQECKCHCHTGHTPTCKKVGICPFMCEHCQPPQQKICRKCMSKHPEKECPYFTQQKDLDKAFKQVVSESTNEIKNVRKAMRKKYPDVYNQSAQQKNARWQDDIREMYKDILPPEQIEATIRYWESFISKLETEARQQAFQGALEDLGKEEDVDELRKKLAFWGTPKAVADQTILHAMAQNQKIAEIRANIEKRKKV